MSRRLEAAEVQALMRLSGSTFMEKEIMLLTLFLCSFKRLILISISFNMRITDIMIAILSFYYDYVASRSFRTHLASFAED